MGEEMQTSKEGTPPGNEAYDPPAERTAEPERGEAAAPDDPMEEQTSGAGYGNSAGAQGE